MGSLSGRLRRLERTSREILRSFELADGSRFYFDPTSAEMFLHACECLRNHDKPERPEPPELVKAVAREGEKGDVPRDGREGGGVVPLRRGGARGAGRDSPEILRGG